jgi:YegS/Rv2252/BmrU family lipid kinase
MLGVANEVKKALFIINKFSGGGFTRKLEGRILTAIQNYDATCVLEYTREPGHATALAKQAVTDGFDCVVAVGGDGTLNEVAQGLLNTRVKMGIIPKGSGNGLARHLGIPLSTEAAAHGVFNSEVLSMDTFTVNGKLSLNVSGIGFDGQVANEFGKNGRRGLLNYVRIALREYAGFQPFEVQMTYDSIQMTRTCFILAIANSSQYGNNARIAPRASVCDERLHLNILSKIPLYRFDLAYRLFQGQIDKSRYSEVYDVRHLNIQTSQPVAYHIDGEPCGTGTDFAVRVLPASLQLLVPNLSRKL